MYKSTFKIPTELLCKKTGSMDSDFVHMTELLTKKYKSKLLNASVLGWADHLTALKCGWLTILVTLSARLVLNNSHWLTDELNNC